MTPEQRTARYLITAATTLTAGGIYLGITVHWWLTLACLYAAAVLLWCAACERAHHRRHLAEQEQARRAAPRKDPAAVPCCRLAERSAGYTQGTDCLRPPGPALDGACCSMWLITSGSLHGSQCPTRRSRSSTG
ncbi:hypothetical protein ACIRLA_41195 [Streptomyces sp. NPDC102364]|uniref:hypothetical protein n=1 Tax=Streptomyces sp. NPDC102364 TaxID=3366161 RepID=UPI0038274EB8